MILENGYFPVVFRVLEMIEPAISLGGGLQIRFTQNSTVLRFHCSVPRVGEIWARFSPTQVTGPYFETHNSLYYRCYIWPGPCHNAHRDLGNSRHHICTRPSRTI